MEKCAKCKREGTILKKLGSWKICAEIKDCAFAFKHMLWKHKQKICTPLLGVGAEQTGGHGSESTQELEREGDLNPLNLAMEGDQ